MEDVVGDLAGNSVPIDEGKIDGFVMQVDGVAVKVLLAQDAPFLHQLTHGGSLPAEQIGGG